ncbi:hypothetical protein VSU19_10210 [Verrucomicrobiales bacterium BCK34]|nr:hypothetical protein [Verrucomicrobiales bacterium BCK34]
MTAIASMFSRKCVATASDSFLTNAKNGDLIEARRPKIICSKPLTLTISYWGLARFGTFDTFNFLKNFTAENRNASDHEEFAKQLSHELTVKIRSLRLNQNQRGVGVHLAFYENVGGKRIPELILVSNFKDPTYSSTSDTVSFSRRTAVDLEKHPDFQGKPSRQEFLSWLENHHVMRFNNGDPELFSSAADAIMKMTMAIRARGKFPKGSDYDAYRLWVREPIETIKEVHRRVCPKKHRIVGGQIHDVLMLPNGEFKTSSKAIPILH